MKTPCLPRGGGIETELDTETRKDGPLPRRFEQEMEPIETLPHSVPVATADKQEAKAALQEVLQQVWGQFKQSFEARMVLFEQAIAQLTTGTLDQELRASVKAETHRLIGSLGSLGVPKGSEVARQIEQLLNLEPAGKNQARQLEELVILLKQTVEDKPSTTATTPNFKMRSGRLLIVDDDVLLTEQIKLEASAWGFQVEVATDLTTARRSISSHLPDIIVLDLTFSHTQESGLTLLEELAQQAPSIPVLVLTAKNELRDRVEVARYQPLCFMIVDLDHFKHINDQHGHEIGDRVFELFGRCLKQFFWFKDIVARWGGEEFVLGLYGITQEQGAKRLTEFLETWCQQEFTGANHETFRVTFSAGVVEYSRNSTK
jgi:diguanylate cyclase (GGDEF)-like protein